jgi:hypothetical protein
MKMFSKRFMTILVLGLVAVMAVTVQAQENNDKYIELVRQDLQAGKTAYMTEGMQLTSEQGDVFWPIYRDYLTKLSAIGDKQIALIKDYAENWDNMTQDKAAEIMKQSFKIRKDQMSLLEKTAKTVAKDLDPIMAGRFVQVERALNLIIDVQLMAEIPLFQEGPGAPAAPQD